MDPIDLRRSSWRKATGPAVADSAELRARAAATIDYSERLGYVFGFGEPDPPPDEPTIVPAPPEV